MKKPYWIRTHAGREFRGVDGSTLGEVRRVSGDPHYGWLTCVTYGDLTYVASERAAMRTVRAELRELKARLTGL